MKVTKVVCFVFFLSFLTGCWDARELREITVVTGMAIDKGKHKRYKLTVEGLNASELNTKTAKGDAPAVVYGLEGDTVAELSQKMNTGIARKLIYSHVRTVVISKELARKGIIDFLDFLERNREIRDDFLFLISKGRADEILRVTSPIEKASSMKLVVQMRTMANNWGGDPKIRLKDMIDAIVSPGREPVLAAIRVQGNKEKGNSVDNMKKVTPDATVVLDSLTVFKKDKYLGDLNVFDSRNYMMIEDKLKLTSFTIPCRKGKNMIIRVYNGSTGRKAKYIHGKPHIYIDFYLESRLDGTQCEDDLTKTETYVKYEKLISKEVTREVESTIKRVQKKFKVDIFGFGEDMYRQDFKQFEKVKDYWNEEFVRADIQVHTLVMLRRAGIRSKSFKTLVK